MNKKCPPLFIIKGISSEAKLVVEKKERWDTNALLWETSLPNGYQPNGI
jgi:hypothetical protein